MVVLLVVFGSGATTRLCMHEFYRVVIAVGNNLEASILTATVCLGFETPEIWAKAISESQVYGSSLAS
jgi:trk system potassium uptake protein